MRQKSIFIIQVLGFMIMLTSAREPTADSATVQHYLYVAVPGIRDYLGYGGHGILVFDMDNDHHFVKRIETRVFTRIKRLRM